MTARCAGRRGTRVSREQDFDEFYLGSVRKVTAQLVALLGDAGEADDAVQEAYARAWQRWDSVSRMDDPVAWVRVVAYRIKVSSWRSTMRRAVAYRRHGPPADVPDMSPDSVALVAALRQIPEAQRRAIVLFHLAGLTVEQVAAEVGAPVGTVKARLSRGRAALAQVLGEPSDTDADMKGRPSYA
ncbi:MAG: SigE family RNA polymerase sigma factor [Catenulispora sp.]|nr:SigE family RNA polymerase sigma factor [Catenulispora sp.]